MLLIKLDMAKAFDSVRWEYLLEVMTQLGFGQRWRDIISLLWGTTTSRIMLNGLLGKPIKHARGLRQGDPLSPMLFILDMDLLQKLLDKATEAGLLSPIGANPVKMRTSLYADDAVLFLRPIAPDVSNLQQLLYHFGKATGMCTNFTKSEIFSVRCDGIDILQILGEFQAKSGEFSCCYLGLPIQLGRLR
jgi:hypothetical protein